VFKKLTGILLLAALCAMAPGRQADAALFGLPKSLKTSPLDGVEMNLRIWGPSAKSFFCIQHLSACQQPPRQLAKPQQSEPKKVALFSMPKALKPELERLSLDTPVLGPMAHNMFCLKYPRECEVRRIAFRGTKRELTPERMSELAEVNLKVNRNIRFERNELGLAGEKWLISPATGDCNDYAVTKRHELLERGWPSRTLLLAEVVTSWGEHHLVVVVRTRQGDFVLDSLNSTVRPWSQTAYRWVRVQSPSDPKSWSTVRTVKDAGRSV
jgi:predicted transglutaminase-like cysteine proteinase